MFVYDRCMPTTSAPSASEFLALDVASLSDAAVRESFLEARAQADQWDLVCARLAAAVHERGIPNEDGATTTPTWIQQHAGQHRGEAKQSVRVGTSLPEFPEVESAWRAGTISASAARTIVSGRCPGAEAEYAALQPLLLSFAEQRQYRTLRQAIIYYQRCARHDRPPHEPAGVFLQRVGDMWSLHGTLDALSGEYLASALAAAQHAPSLDDLRSPAERRAEALGLVAKSFLDAGNGEFEHTNAPHVSVHLDWATLTHGTPFASIGTDGTPVSRSVIEQVLCESNITRIVTGPKGDILDVGRANRTPSRALRKAVIARDQHCRFPGCDRPAGWSEIHHVEPWQHGGPTDLANLVLLCSHHHHVVHRPDWIAKLHDDEFVVITPAGREYRSRPPSRAPTSAA